MKNIREDLNNTAGVNWDKVAQAEKLVDAMYTKYKINDTDKIHSILVGKYGLTDREADIAINNAQHDRSEKSYMEGNSNKSTSLNEVKKLQKIAGIITESEYQEAMSSQAMDFQLDPPDGYFGDDPSEEDQELEQAVEAKVSEMAAELVANPEDVSKVVEKAVQVIHSRGIGDLMQKYAKHGNEVWNIADDLVHMAMKQLNISPDYDKAEGGL